MTFLIAYDLRSPNDKSEDYERVIGAIKTNFSWCHLQKSVWLVNTAFNAREIRELITPYLKTDDSLLVARLEGNWASWALGDARNNWLRQQSF